MGPAEFSMIIAILLSILNIINMIMVLKDKVSAPNDEQNRRLTLLEEDVRDLKKRHDNAYDDIDNLKIANKVIMKSMSALLSHGIEGNNIDEMKLAREELNDYLFEQVGGH